MPDQDQGAAPAPEADVAARLRQQTTLARFGEFALRSESLDEILQESCRLVGEALGTDLAKVLELQADGRTLLVRAGVGWKPGVVGHTRIEASESSSEGHALRTDEPVISPDLAHETRFTTPAFLHDNGVRALANVVIIGGRDRPHYGVLQVDSRSPRRFDANDISFLRTYANLLAAAVDRLQVLHATRRTEAFVRASSEVLYSLSADWSELRQLTGGGFLADTDAANRNWLADYIPEDERPRVEAEIGRAIATGTPYHLEHRVRLANGTVGWVLSRATPLLDAGGAITEWFGAASDITARRQAEEALQQSERWLRQAQEAGNIGAFWVAIPEGVLHPTPEFCRLYGVPVRELFPASEIEALVLPEDTGSMSTDASRSVGQAVHDATYRIRRPDTGELRWISRKAEFEHDAQDRPVRWAGIAQDITVAREQATALARLNQDLERRVEERTRERDRIWRLSRDMLGVATADGVWLSVNPAWTAILGWSEAEIAGRTTCWLQHPDDLDATQRGRERLKAGESLHGFEHRLRTRDGGHRVINWTAVPFEGLIYGVGRDITAEREQALALARTEDALRQSQKMEAIGQLTGGVAHDFNNLLTVIRSSADLLKRPNLAEERRTRYIAAISDTVERAARLTSQLLAFARRQALRPETFAACDGVRSLGDMLGTLTGTQVEVVTALPETPCLVNADASQFDTALVNMAVNARDAMGGKGRLTIGVEAVDRIPATRLHPTVTGDFVAVSISDTGSGIPPDRLERIFEPFFTTKDVGKGTGLGLSQVFGFAKQSGGEVTVESRVGEGTTFTIFLPSVAEAVRPPEAVDPAPPMDGHGACILVVEDNADVGSFATQTLAELGYRTVWSDSAEAALAELARGADRFDVVFSDVVMPGMDGIELGQRIRRDHHDLPVVLTSGYSHVLAQNGTHGFELLHKPYSIEQLSRVLRKAATWQRRRRIMAG